MTIEEQLSPHLLDRRSFLRFLAAGSAAMAFLPHGAAFARKVETKKAKAKSVILLWMGGGPSQMDTFDPKPGTKTGGKFKAIDTSAKGMKVAEVLPSVAEQGKHLSILRSVTTKEASHERASHLLHTGYTPIQNLEFAPVGTVVSNELSPKDFPLPSFIALSPPAIPRSRVFGERHLPFTIENPRRPLPNIESLVEANRDLARSKLLAEQDVAFAEGRRGKEMDKARAAAKRAHDMMTTPLLRAFDLGKEPAATRKRYGPGFGEKCLLARRLVEAGVPFIEVGLGGWDNHANVFDAVKRNCGQLDRGMGALIGDLAEKGILDETLVLWMGEFGRTPAINRTNGRDHWSKCFSVVMAGGGVEGGRVVGHTGREGREITKRAIETDDLFTTIYHTLGIDPEMDYETQTRVVTVGGYSGKVIRELF
jgi:hypothetical protein